VIGFTRQRRIIKKGPFRTPITAPLHFINVGIVDARNGAVLAYAGVSTFSDIGKGDDKKLVDSLTRSLQKLPSGTPAGKK
jgi:hypothetical protein